MNNYEPVPDFYDIIPKKHLLPRVTYKNYDKCRMEIPAMIAIIGKSGSKKTNCCAYLMKMLQCFNKIFIFDKDLGADPIYNWIIDMLEDIEKKTGKQIIYYSDDIEDIMSPEEFDMNDRNLVIIDNHVLEKKNKAIVNLFKSGRKWNISVIYQSQSFFAIPKFIRDQLGYIILKTITNSQDLKLILSRYKLPFSLSALEALYKFATTKPCDFFMIDLMTKDPLYQVRINFQPLMLRSEANDENIDKTKKEKLQIELI